MRTTYKKVHLQDFPECVAVPGIGNILMNVIITNASHDCLSNLGLYTTASLAAQFK